MIELKIAGVRTRKPEKSERVACPAFDEILLKFREATKEGKPGQSVEDKMRGDQTKKEKKTPLHANAMAKGINPNKTPLGAKGKPKGRPKTDSD